MIPANITTELTNLQSQITAAAPMASASVATITAIQLNANQLDNDIQTALANAAGGLDTWIAPSDPAAITSGILGLLVNAQDQNSLALMDGLVSRSIKNLALI